MPSLLAVFFLFGGYGLTAGVLSAVALRRVAHSRAALAAAGTVALVAWVAGWAIWETGSCGRGCIRDASPAFMLVPVQLLGFVIGAAAVGFVADGAAVRTR